MPGRAGRHRDRARVPLARLEADGPSIAPPPRPEVPFALLLLHGSLESYRGPDAPSGAKSTAPFSREELAATGCLVGRRWATTTPSTSSGARTGARLGRLLRVARPAEASTRRAHGRS